MLTRWAVLLIGLAVAAPATAEEMSPERARRFTVGKLFAFSCLTGRGASGVSTATGLSPAPFNFLAQGQSARLRCRRAH